MKTEDWYLTFIMIRFVTVIDEICVMIAFATVEVLYWSPILPLILAQCVDWLILTLDWTCGYSWVKFRCAAATRLNSHCVLILERINCKLSFPDRTLVLNFLDFSGWQIFDTLLMPFAQVHLTLESPNFFSLWWKHRSIKLA